MKLFFLGALSALLLLSVAAWLTQPGSHADGKTVLLWVSDDNPARREQIALFNKLHRQYDLRRSGSLLIRV